MFDTGVEYRKISHMAITRKITVKVLRSCSIRLNGPVAQGLPKPSVPGCSLSLHRELTPAYANSVARFASPALWQSSKPTDDPRLTRALGLPFSRAAQARIHSYLIKRSEIARWLWCLLCWPSS